ncbi:MAG TPA: NAD(P)/FAD-dependent oxidoreductase [Anaerolineales bacterium]|nr:NAD(P)/FAD-dependent oxidoreductase [Anaerolineales bacterium]
MTDRDCEVAIVGAGPAGLATAMHLIRLDATWADRLVVLEKEVHPRHKLCGGAITRFGLDQLSRLGLTLDVPFVPIDELRLQYRNQAVNVYGRPIVAVTWRQEFDAWLASTARNKGVAVHEDTPVQGLERQGNRILLHTPRGSYRARAVVGADGSTGLVRRWVGARERPPHVARLLEVVTEAAGDEPEYRYRMARLDFSGLRARLQGYYWDFPSLIEGDPRMNSGVYDARVDTSRARASLPDHLTVGILHGERRGEKLKVQGHPIHWFSPANQFSAPGVVLVGDAAGADPLFGEGIGVGLAYGTVAANAIRRASLRHDFSFASYRRRLLVSSLGRYLIRRWLLGLVSYRFGGVDLFVRALWRTGKLFAPLANKNSPSPAIRSPLEGAGARPPAPEEAAIRSARRSRLPASDTIQSLGQFGGKTE